MTLVTLEKIVRRFGEHLVLDGLSLRVDEGDRIGVIGDNGAGKTTMVRILAGVDDADTGQRNCRKDLSIAYGAQMPALPQGTTVRAFVMAGNGTHNELERRMRGLEGAMARGESAALADYGHLQAAFEAGGGYDRSHRIEKVLSGLGFAAQDLDKDVAVLSGGERSRVQLALLMTTPAELLILDEPTNHLDLWGIEFVEDYVRRHPGAVIVVSHDRAFLDNCVTSILDVADGVATRYKGNFSHYSQQRDTRLLSEARQFKNQRDFIEKEMDYIRRNMAGQNSSQAKGRLKRLQRLQLLDKPKGPRAQMRLAFGGGKGLRGQTVIEGEGLDLRLGERALLSDAGLRVEFGEIVALLGRNGTGKTTLLRALAGRQPISGALKRSHNLRVGYFSQDQEDLPWQGTVLDAMKELDRTVDEKPLRDHLALFLFCGDDVDKPVAELSGGEKQRLSMARMTRAQFDLLLMDEPTNHLDVSATEGLEQALKEFAGTVILITHDRRLVDEVADRILWLEDGKLRSFTGLQRCLQTLADERAAARAAEQAAAQRRSAREPEPEPEPARGAAATGRIRNPLMFQKLEERIFDLEEQIAGAKAAMLEPDNYQSVAKMKELQGRVAALEAQLAAAYHEWENWQ